MATKRARRQPVFRVSHMMSIPVAQSLWCGRRETAVAIFEKDDAKTMDRMLEACHGLAGATHFKRHDTSLIGKVPEGTKNEHPWGFLTFGLVHRDDQVKECVVSVIHHRAEISCIDALLREAETVPWRTLKELNL